MAVFEGTKLVEFMLKKHGTWPAQNICNTTVGHSNTKPVSNLRG
jgi:hypothetical protein